MTIPVSPIAAAQRDLTDAVAAGNVTQIRDAHAKLVAANMAATESEPFTAWISGPAMREVTGKASGQGDAVKALLTAAKTLAERVNGSDVFDVEGTQALAFAQAAAVAQRVEQGRA